MYLKDILKQYNVKPNKRLGQNFLISEYHLNKIIDSMAIEDGGSILEIGSGSGNLTRVLAKDATSVIAIEKDVRLFDVLTDIFKESPNVSLINADFLAIDLKSYFNKYGLLRIVGNLPYYISTQIIEKIIENRKIIKDGYLMLQREYVERMIAVSGSKKYGRLSIFAQTFLNLKRLFKVPKSCFYPQPKVDSYFISFNIKDDCIIEDAALLSLVTSEFFQKRRKKITTIIKNSKILTGLNIASVMYNLGIDLNQRPEQLSVCKYIDIVKNMEG
ncbi:MAG: 16S rRNA (adenine(1518)-N(6)/adenine(1519)-N(6))-dimethyltransferase RsmA [Candidatus Kaelpia aquatica]|nr:16S rRNA (adenine(1518)-N(6)/adenine(1519)-N(6))-dimethyltransferase RsmA [Candidatus Kaelpia aquatica]